MPPAAPPPAAALRRRSHDGDHMNALNPNAAVDCTVTAGRDGFATGKEHVPACISAAVTAKSFSVLKYRRWPTSTGAIAAAMIMLVVAKVLSAAELFLADYTFLYEILLLYQCMGVGEHIIRCIHHLNTI